MNSFNDEVCEYISTPAIENFSTPAIENFYEVCEYTSMPVTENFGCYWWKMQSADTKCKSGCRQNYGAKSWCT